MLGVWSRRTSPVGGTWGAPSCNDESKLDEYKPKKKDQDKPKLIMISKTLYAYINICAKHKLMYLSPCDMPSPLSNACCGRSFSFRFLFLLTFALRTKSMALRATVLALVLI